MKEELFSLAEVKRGRVDEDEEFYCEENDYAHEIVNKLDEFCDKKIELFHDENNQELSEKVKELLIEF